LRPFFGSIVYRGNLRPGQFARTRHNQGNFIMQTSKHPSGNSPLDEKLKELIAIGAAVAGHCQPCLTHHVAKARELGLSVDEIRAAIGVGHMVEKGAMAAMNNFSRRVLDEPVGTTAGCCAPPSGPGAKCGG
jgi:AhpD family alkylhydroperoxidase